MTVPFLIVLLFVHKMEAVSWQYSQGLYDLQKQKYDKAYQRLSPYLSYHPYNAELLYDIGIACYRNKDFNSAILYFQKAVEHAKNQKIKEQSLFNLGNAQAQSDQLEAARDSYVQTLAINPDNEDAKKNLAIIEEQLKKQQNQQEQKEQQKNNQKKQDSDQSKDKEDSSKSKEKQEKENGDQNKKKEEQKDSEQQKSEEKENSDGKNDHEEKGDSQKSSEKKEQGCEQKLDQEQKEQDQKKQSDGSSQEKQKQNGNDQPQKSQGKGNKEEQAKEEESQGMEPKDSQDELTKSLSQEEQWMASFLDKIEESQKKAQKEFVKASLIQTKERKNPQGPAW